MLISNPLSEANCVRLVTTSVPAIEKAPTFDVESRVKLTPSKSFVNDASTSFLQEVKNMAAPKIETVNRLKIFVVILICSFIVAKYY